MNGIGPNLDILFGQNPGPSVLNEGVHAAGIHCNNGQTRRHGLQDDHALGLRCGRKDEEIAQTEIVRDMMLRDRPDQAHLRGQILVPDGPGQMRPLLAIPNHKKTKGGRVAVLEFPHRRDQEVEVFFLRKPRHGDQYFPTVRVVSGPERSKLARFLWLESLDLYSCRVNMHGPVHPDQPHIIPRHRRRNDDLVTAVREAPHEPVRDHVAKEDTRQGDRMRILFQPRVVGEDRRDVQPTRHAMPQRPEPEGMVKVDHVRPELSDRLPRPRMQRIGDTDKAARFNQCRNAHDAGLFDVLAVGGCDHQHLVSELFQPFFQAIDRDRDTADERQIGIGEHHHLERAAKVDGDTAIVIGIVVPLPEQAVVEIHADDDESRKDE